MERGTTHQRALSLDEVLTLGSNARSKVGLPGGGFVYVRALTGEEVRQYRKILGAGGRVKLDARDRTQEIDLDVGAAGIYLVKAGTVNEDGSQLFAEKTTDEIGSLPYPVIDAIGSAVHELSGLADEDEEEATDPLEG